MLASFFVFESKTLQAQDFIFDGVKVKDFKACDSEVLAENTCPQTTGLLPGYALKKGKTAARKYLEKTEGKGKDKKIFYTCQASETPGGNDKPCDKATACNCRLFELDPKKGSEWTIAQNQIKGNVGSANEFAVPKKGFDYACICKK
ncbi:hypothetical protein L0222_04870 [bacterium]|nr:hypothetical protein [bacterium]MCI0603362.1 hypothetical protein [bacterium]